MEFVMRSELTSEDLYLLEQAKAVSYHAFNKRSNAPIGCAGITCGGNIFRGTFFESASGPEGVCAEKSVITAANSAGDLELRTLAIVGGHSEADDEAIPTPCGGCRQVIYDIAEAIDFDIVVLCSNLALSTTLRASISSLLPFPFSSERQNGGSKVWLRSGWAMRVRREKS